MPPPDPFHQSCVLTISADSPLPRRGAEPGVVVHVGRKCPNRLVREVTGLSVSKYFDRSPLSSKLGLNVTWPLWPKSTVNSAFVGLVTCTLCL